ncbi:hypothetical protein CRUP_028373 [Coryphaenoides rupestris]|nr:hypothetical protein CRUP_028373 [Coryphaenoides rupestris]
MNQGVCYYYNDTDYVDFHTAVSRCLDENAMLVGGLVPAGVHPLGGRRTQQRLRGGTVWGWSDLNCGRAEAGYVCKKLPGDNDTAASPTPPWVGYCPAGWQLFNDKCFLFRGKEGDGLADFTAAQSFCKEKEGSLAVIDSQSENEFVASYLKDLKRSAWIGMSDRVAENTYTWHDGSAVLYTNWDTNEPNNHGGSVRVASSSSSSSSRTASPCPTATWRAAAADIAPPPPGPCPDGYVSWMLSCYLLVEQPATWERAQRDCELRGDNLASVDMSYDQAFLPASSRTRAASAWKPPGLAAPGTTPSVRKTSPTSASAPRYLCRQAGAELASVHSRAETMFLRQLNFTKHNVWIGLARDGNSAWAWSDDSALAYVNWADGEPSAAFRPGELAEEGCVELYPDGRWNDNNCLQTRGFACRHLRDGEEQVSPPDTIWSGGVIAGVVIGVLALAVLVAGGLFCVAVKVSSRRMSMRLPTSQQQATFVNPNFIPDSAS